MNKECHHSYIEISLKYPADPIFICERCQNIAAGGCLAIRRRIVPKQRGATYLFKKIEQKNFNDDKTASQATYYVDHLWNPITGKIFKKYRCRHKIVYNKQTNKLYRLYKVAKSRVWQIRDIGYTGAWFHTDLGYDPYLVAARGNAGVANILRMIWTHGEAMKIAIALRGGKNMAALKLNEEHIRKITTETDDVAKTIVAMAMRGWSSVGIDVVLEHGAGYPALAAHDFAPFYSLASMRTKLSGTEEQLALAMSTKRYARILRALGNRSCKIPYDRLSRNLSGLKKFVNEIGREITHRDWYSSVSEELREIMANSFKNDFDVKEETAAGMIRIEHGKHTYIIIPCVPTVKAIRDTGAYIEVDIHHPSSISKIIAFIKRNGRP